VGAMANVLARERVLGEEARAARWRLGAMVFGSPS
jgi:hypothetical protein